MHERCLTAHRGRAPELALPYAGCMPRYFHVSSGLNRESIGEHGLDSSLMGAARGIAGSTRPEVDGIFLGHEHDVDYFTRLNNTGTEVDVWAVDGIDEDDLIDSPNGYLYLPGVIPADRLILIATDIPAGER